MHHKQNNKERKSHLQGLRPFGSTLPRGIKGILKKNGYNYSVIIGKWEKLVGKHLASLCFPKSIKMSGDKNGILILSVKRGDEINVEYSKKEIIDKINSFFGYLLVKEIKLYSLNSENKKKKKEISKKLPNNFKKQIDEIENEDIKNSISQLLDAFKNV